MNPESLNDLFKRYLTGDDICPSYTEATHKVRLTISKDSQFKSLSSLSLDDKTGIVDEAVFKASESGYEVLYVGLEPDHVALGCRKKPALEMMAEAVDD